MFDSPTTPEAGQASSATAWRPRRPAGLYGALALMLLGAGAVLAFSGILPRPEAPAPPAVAEPPPALTVAVAPAGTRPMLRVVSGDGSVVAWQELILGADIGGLRVIEVAVEEGDTVHAGQLLARLDDSVLSAQAAQAEAAVAEAAAALEMARADLARAEELLRSRTGTRQNLEQRQSAARQAEARLISARARRDETAARLAQTRILAPTDGVVSRRAALLGSVPAPGQEMFRILRDGRLELDARIPELDLAGVEPGQEVRVRHGDRVIPARVRAVAPTVAPETRLGLVHIALPANSGLRPGMFARAEILAGKREVVALPAEAVVFREGAPVAFVLPEGSDRVELRRIAAGAHRDGTVEVTEGIRAGERVVVAGAGFLSDGDHVRLATPLPR